MADLRFPIGEFVFPEGIDERQRQEWIDAIAATPERLREAVAGLDDSQLDTPYRPGGWTVRQVVHHLPDSHLNSYVRFKLALTEDTPTIRPYDEKRWAELSDAEEPIEVSLRLLETLHARWVSLLRFLSPEDYARAFLHPEFARKITLEQNLALYAWHGRHHVAHVTSLRERMGW